MCGMPRSDDDEEVLLATVMLLARLSDAGEI